MRAQHCMSVRRMGKKVLDLLYFLSCIDIDKKLGSVAMVIQVRREMTLISTTVGVFRRSGDCCFCQMVNNEDEK